MTLIEYIFIRFFNLRRRLFGITPSEIIKAVIFVSYFDLMWIFSLTAFIGIIIFHFFGYKPNFFWVMLIVGIVIIIHRDRQLGTEESFKKIKLKYKRLKPKVDKRLSFMARIYLISTVIIFIFSCILLYKA